MTIQSQAEKKERIAELRAELAEAEAELQADEGSQQGIAAMESMFPESMPFTREPQPSRRAADAAPVKASTTNPHNIESSYASVTAAERAAFREANNSPVLQ